jgi:hypothetical protein
LNDDWRWNKQELGGRGTWSPRLGKEKRRECKREERIGKGKEEKGKEENEGEEEKGEGKNEKKRTRTRGVERKINLKKKEISDSLVFAAAALFHNHIGLP